MRIPTVKDIEAAGRRISGVASVTPLVASPSLSRRFGIGVSLKLECCQPIRVFKIRGAYNKISQARPRGVVAASSGNHGIAVAYSSWLLGKRCTVVVPENAVSEKVAAIREFGADVVVFGRYSQERESRARSIAKLQRCEFVHPYDDPDVVAGQGTCGMEMVRQRKLDSIVVPVGGGGLISGIAIAAKALRPSVKVFGVEPEGAAKLSRSLEKGQRIVIESPHSIADGLIPSSVGEIAFETCRRLVDGVFLVSDDRISAAAKLLAREAHIFPEPSGAATVAAMFDEGNVSRLGRNTGLVISGGNVQLNFLRKTLG
jgi:threonine dehydratase